MAHDAFTVRQAGHGDAPALAAFIRRLGLFPRFDAESPEVTAERVARHVGLCLADDSHTVLLAERDGHLIAYASVHWLPYLILKGPEGYLSELFVSEEHRGRGTGSALLEAVIAEGRRRGCARLMLEAVRARESFERGFYQERGWIERPDMANLVHRYEDEG